MRKCSQLSNYELPCWKSGHPERDPGNDSPVPGPGRVFLQAGWSDGLPGPSPHLSACLLGRRATLQLSCSNWHTHAAMHPLSGSGWTAPPTGGKNKSIKKQLHLKCAIFFWHTLSARSLHWVHPYGCINTCILIYYNETLRVRDWISLILNLMSSHYVLFWGDMASGVHFPQESCQHHAEMQLPV